MKNKYFMPLAIVAFVALQAFNLRSPILEEIPFPEEFDSWQIVKASVKDSISSATFANKEAMIGFNTGIFPNDSKIVFEVWNNQANSDGTKRRVKLDLMQRDSVKYPDSNGWLFSHFSGNSKENDVKTMVESMKCFSCHQKEPDNVFAELK